MAGRSFADVPASTRASAGSRQRVPMFFIGTVLFAPTSAVTPLAE
jgi:hypothetical protein